MAMEAPAEAVSQVAAAPGGLLPALTVWAATRVVAVGVVAVRVVEPVELATLGLPALARAVMVAPAAQTPLPARPRRG
jgi:hypothetical protein